MDVRYDVIVLVTLPVVLDGVIEHLVISLGVLDWVIEHKSDGLAAAWVYIISYLNSYRMGT